MSSRAARSVAWGLWSLLMVAVAVLVLAGSRDPGVWGTVGGVLFIVVFATTGVLVTPRVPRNPIGWLLCLAAVSFTTGGFCELVLDRAAEQQQPGLLVVSAAWVGSFVWMLGIGPAATFVLLLFPDGHLPSPRWRAVGWLSGIALAATMVGSAVEPGPLEGTDVDNPVGLDPALAGLARTVEGAGLLLFLACILLSGASLVARYRAAGHEQRQQLKWLAWSLPVVLAWLLASIVVGAAFEGDAAIDVANALSSVGLVVVPIAICLAILRHRLYDIDLVIRRTIVYGSLTATLVAVYLASVLTLRLVLAPVTGESDLAVAASTLAVAALFGPLRARIQASVDRRFYRRRYDASLTLQAFTGRLRQEVDLRMTASDLREVVREAMQPEHVSLWLRKADDDPHPHPSPHGNDSRTPGL